jgi:hypothetical protein
MRKINCIIIIVLIFVSFNTFGQIVDFRNYQKHINEAELKIIKGEKKEALDIYYSILKETDGNFSKDIYNSLILANELNKLDTFFSLFELIKKKNFDNEYIIGLKEFSNLHKDKRWQEFLKTNNAIIYIDTALRKKINQLEFADQYFRNKMGSYEVYGDTIKKIDSINISYILNLIVNTGLPGEKEIGAKDISGTQGYDIVLMHHCQSRSLNKNLINLTPFLLNSVIEGRIEPNKCSEFLETQNGEFNTGVYDIFIVQYNEKKSNYLTWNYSEKQKLLIEEYRKLSCLEPLNDYYKKIKFVTTNKDNKFSFDVRLNTFYLGSDEEYLNYTKKMIEIE